MILVTHHYRKRLYLRTKVTDENSNDLMYKSIFLLGCTFSENSYFIRWWNGNVPTKLSAEEERISDICYRETSNLPQNTREERKRASWEYIKCCENGVKFRANLLQPLKP